jgi:hypothetical protein
MQQHYYTKDNKYIAPYSLNKEDWGYCYYYHLTRLDNKHKFYFSSDYTLSEEEINKQIEESLCH